MSPKPAEIDADEMRHWIGKTETIQDVITQRLVDSLAATFETERNFPNRIQKTPVTLHWCLAPSIYPMSGLGEDGHPSRGGFLPPIPLPKRMWAGGQLEFSGGLGAGDSVERVSRVLNIETKLGRSGRLCFVQVEHNLTTERGAVVRERQDIVYREEETKSARRPTSNPSNRITVKPRHRLRMRSDPVLLFRYSALTFNAHRIHYDYSYAVNKEGYSGLVVHGPLQAGLLAEFGAELMAGNAPRRFEFRGIEPLMEGEEFSLNAADDENGLLLWIENLAGHITMKAMASW